MSLPEIPVLTDADTPLALFEKKRGLAQSLFDVCRKLIPGFILGYLARKSEDWLGRAQPPYRQELDKIADGIGSEAYALNLSYEWGCTTTAFNDAARGGVTMYRTLDWPIKGMGDKLVVAKHSGTAGTYWNIAYPGFVGVLNGVAKGRFTAAINSAPIPSYGWGPLVDYPLSKRDNLRHGGMPAPFLLRKVFEECADYKTAVKMLAETPLMAPAIFTVAGINDGDHCVIERMHDKAIIHDGAKEGFVCATNGWINDEWPAHDRPTSPRKRRAEMIADMGTYKGDFDWLDGTILNSRTRLAFEANARNGTLTLKGVDGRKDATQILKLSLD
jgi:hypothetical protein